MTTERAFANAALAGGDSEPMPHAGQVTLNPVALPFDLPENVRAAIADDVVVGLGWCAHRGVRWYRKRCQAGRAVVSHSV